MTIRWAAKGGIAVGIPVFEGYPTHNLRYPLPYAICIVPEKDKKGLERISFLIEEELNVKRLIVVGAE